MVASLCKCQHSFIRDPFMSSLKNKLRNEAIRAERSKKKYRLNKNKKIKWRNETLLYCEMSERNDMAFSIAYLRVVSIKLKCITNLCWFVKYFAGKTICFGSMCFSQLIHICLFCFAYDCFSYFALGFGIAREKLNIIWSLSNRIKMFAHSFAWIEFPL